MNHLSAQTIQHLMRKHHKTIRGIAKDWNLTLKRVRYVRLHGVGASEEAIAAELWFMDRHFTFKTGCHANLPLLPEPPSRLTKAGRKALEMGQGILTNLITPRL